MNRLLLLLLALNCLLGWSGNAPSDSVPLADPFILLDDGVYYAYGTHSPDGIECYTSTDLKHWTLRGLALSRDDTTEEQWFWAPEVYHRNGRYYMYYSANEHLYVATSTSPVGPFRQEGGRMMYSLIGDEKCIDSTIFFDDDGTPYCFFVRFTDGNAIWMCQLSPDLMTPVKGTLHECLHVTEAWESHLGRVTEGPFVWKARGTYYLTYSANDFHSPDYAVGYATSTAIMGAWKKSADSPIVRRAHGLLGTGHHSFFRDRRGRLRIVYHSHYSAEEVSPRLMHIGTMQLKHNQLRMKR